MDRKIKSVKNRIEKDLIWLRQRLVLEKFKKVTPAIINTIAVILDSDTGALKTIIPRIAVPAAHHTKCYP